VNPHILREKEKGEREREIKELPFVSAASSWLCTAEI
jgi:hypothetical protein